MAVETAPRTPPPWFVHTAWRVHRGLYRLSGGRFLWTPRNRRDWGALHLTTTGRRSGRARGVILGYLEHGDALVLLAMNGWDEGEPAWWLNLQQHPDALVRTAGDPPRQVRARAAAGEERDRLWRLWTAVDPTLQALAARRATDTAVVVLDPLNRPGTCRRRCGRPDWVRARRRPAVRDRPQPRPGLDPPLPAAGAAG
jgi:F420H(2)-dependent quinone reductase